MGERGQGTGRSGGAAGPGGDGDRRIPGLDPAVVRQIVKLGKEELLLQLIGTFLEHAPARLEGVREGLSDGDYKRIERSAHSLRSSLASLGAAALARLAGELEAAAREGRADGLAELAGSFQAGFAVLERDLRATLEEPSP